MKNNRHISEDNGIDIYSSSKGKGKHSKGRQHTSKKKGKRTAVIVVVSIVSVLAILVSSAFIYYNSILEKVQRGEFNVSNVEANNDVFTEDVKNIALFGLDTRSDKMTGRADAIMILTIDKKHNKIKMTSIARDSYVDIEKADGTVIKDKLTHSYFFPEIYPAIWKKAAKEGKPTPTGAEVAVKAINKNFNMNITDYATINFFGMVDIIDYIGGITLDIDSAEKEVMNTEYVPHLNDLGLKCAKITKTGEQHVTGAQALAYARNRYTSGDEVARGTRQREVLTACYTKVKTLGLTKFPKLIELALSDCETSLSNGEITSIASWAMLNSPSIENLGLPDDDCNPKGGKEAIINDVWYYIYDLDIATQKIHDFINEEGSYVYPTTLTVSNNSGKS